MLRRRRYFTFALEPKCVLLSSRTVTVAAVDAAPPRRQSQQPPAISSDLSFPTTISHASPRGGPWTTSDFESQQPAPSPRKLGGLLSAAKQGKGAIDKALRHIFDSDAVPDRSSHPIWLLGVPYPGWEPQPAPSQEGASAADARASPASASSKAKGRASPDPGAAWPPAFYADFTSRVWLTYRSQIPSPIRDTRLVELEPCSVFGPPATATAPAHGEEESRSPTVARKVWPWAGEKTWSADTGWGCMLRTGQSLLANALVRIALGRDWRRPPHPVATPEYATYVRIMTWFLDTPDPHAPFSVHRMALAGKELGTDVGQWFGPSIAAGAIRTLVSAFPECGLGVSVASDGALYQSEVFAASHSDPSNAPRRQLRSEWGDRPVLLLLGIRLGIERVNPIYYDSVKTLFTFPQSVGIAGGRPSSSYYFVGSQGEGLFYLDPHYPRPAVPLRPPPRKGYSNVPEAQEEPKRASSMEETRRHKRPSGGQSQSSSNTGSSRFSYHTPSSPSPLQHTLSAASETSRASNSSAARGDADDDSRGVYGEVDEVTDEDGDAWDASDVRSPPPEYHQHAKHRLAGASPPLDEPTPLAKSPKARPRPRTSMGTNPSPTPSPSPSPASSSARTGASRGPVLDPVQLHYVNAYSAAELRTFHCERVRKMPLGGLDPSMLIGFVCRDERDWLDFRQRVAQLPKMMFAVENEPPMWHGADIDDDITDSEEELEVGAGGEGEGESEDDEADDDDDDLPRGDVDEDEVAMTQEEGEGRRKRGIQTGAYSD